MFLKQGALESLEPFEDFMLLPASDKATAMTPPENGLTRSDALVLVN